MPSTTTSLLNVRRAALSLALPAILAAAAAPAAVAQDPAPIRPPAVAVAPIADDPTAGPAAGPVLPPVASTARPDFQMPFPCGQTWHASTYGDDPEVDEDDDHWPDEDSIDLAQRDADLKDLSLGEPVLASAAGVVKASFMSGDETHVYIDHGGGWETYYVHNIDLGPLQVGERVAQGQQIGRVGTAGSPTVHLHYTQLFNGEAVRVMFDGTEIATHQGDTSSWGKWGKRDAEQLTSANCPANSLLSYRQFDTNRVLAYTPGTGRAFSVELDGDGFGANVFNQDLDHRWTSFTPFVRNGQPHFFRYAAATGAVEFSRINALSVEQKSARTWSPNWSHFMPFTIGGQTYVLAYSQLYGWANFDRINGEGTDTTTVSKDVWTRGWSSLESFELGGVTYAVMYKRSSGAVRIERLSVVAGNIVRTPVFVGSGPAGMSHLVPLVQNGAATLLGYNPTTGVARFQKLSPQAIPYPNATGTEQWTTDWTSFTPFYVNGRPYVHLNKVRTGESGTVKLDAGFTSTTKVSSQNWSPGHA